MPEQTTLYNPLNERLKKQYEEGLIHGLYRDERTANAAWRAINLFEQCTAKEDFTSFSTEQAKSFKRWLVKQTNGKGELLSLATVRSTLKYLRDFFEWLAKHPKYMGKINWQATTFLHLSDNDDRAGRATRELPVPIVEELHKVLQAMPHGTDIEKRDRAVIAFLALTGMRDDALISLRMKDVNRAKREIWQNPRYVKTKGRKSIVTTFMPFDALWEEIALEWLDHAQQVLSLQADDPLFPKTAVAPNAETLSFEVNGLSRQHWANAAPVREIFKAGFAAAGLPYHNPHSVRKMLSIWVMEHGTQLQYKAFSQNIGHKHVMTTYNAYGDMPDHKRHSVINTIGKCDIDLAQVSQEALMAEVMRRMGH